MMEFSLPYQLAMRDQAPKMFNRLRRTGALAAHVKAKAAEARRLYAQLAEGLERLPSGLVKGAHNRRRIEEQVFATLIEFPPDETSPANRTLEPDLDEGPQTAT